MPEDTVWMMMSEKYAMVHINECVYISDYLEGGLTRSGRRMKIHSPRGMMLRSKIYLENDKVRLKVRIKEAAEQLSGKGMFYLLYVPSLLIQKKWDREIRKG